MGIDKEDFVIDGFKIRQDGRIDAVCLRILGKTDSEWHYYRLWSDHECPDMCPVRHLLLYIYLLGWKGGKLFPGSSFLTSKKAREGKGGVFNTCIEYNSFDKAFKRSVLVALPQMETGVRKMKVGLHMFRKTAYLLAILGLGEWAAIKIDARHKCDADAKGYTGDAFTRRRDQETDPDPNNVVCEYQPSTINDPTCAINPSIHVAMPESIVELADTFVASLQVPRPFVRNQKNLIAAALKLNYGLSDLERFEAELNNNPALSVASKAVLLGMYKKRSVATAQDFSEDDVTMDNGEPSTKRRRTVAAVVCSRAPTAKLDDRDRLAHIPDLKDKVSAYVKYNEEKVPLDTTPLSATDKRWLNRTLKPIVECLQTHIEDDVDRFCQHWEAAFNAKFGDFCCLGSKSRVCGDCNKNKKSS